MKTIFSTLKIFLLIFLGISSIACFGQQITSADTSWNVYLVVLNPGLDHVKATINDSTIFVARKGQRMLYLNNPHAAFIADGRYGYVSPDQLQKVDQPCFKFNFSKHPFSYAEDNALCQIAAIKGINLNALVQRIQHKESKAMFAFFKLKEEVDAASAEIFNEEFWAVIHLWTDKELSSFLASLQFTDRKDFCALLQDTSYCNPSAYYKLYYPLC